MPDVDSPRGVLRSAMPVCHHLAGGVMMAVLILAGCSMPGSARDTETHRAPTAGEKADLNADDTRFVVVYLDTLDLSVTDQEWGSPQAGKSVDGNPLTLKGQVYTHGIGTHAFSELRVDLKGAAQSFEAVVGVDDESETSGSVTFAILVDGKEIKLTGILRGGDEPEVISVALRGARELTLLVEDGGDDINCDHADWADARLVLVPGARQRPQTVALPPEPLPQIAISRSAKPAIHAPRITGATPGRPFLFRIPATGAGPLRFSAKNLPAGLRLDAQTGIISGSLAGNGTTVVEIAVSGPAGSMRSPLTIVGAPHSLALTPPMGWNSWNVWGTAVDDAKVRAAADWMVKSGLAAHGYQYINIDDAWQGKRDANGRIRGNDKFPDMKALANYVHSKGLKLGIYSSPGTLTCAGYEGSYQHERLDAQTYAEWGIDLLKYDWCSYGKIAPDPNEEQLRKPYEVMRAALDECGRDIVHSICQYGMGNVAAWGAAVGGNYWRTTGDITDTWASMTGIGFGQNGLEIFAGPGHWNDPDMLVVGKVGWGPKLHPTRLTPNEQLTHMTLWSLLAAPLLIGCDLSDLDEFTLALLTNPEVLEVNQDPLGRQAARVAANGRLEVWARPLADGSVAVGLFNRGRITGPVSVTWDALKLTGPQRVRDLWKRQDVGTFNGTYSATVPRHGAVLLKIGG